MSDIPEPFIIKDPKNYSTYHYEKAFNKVTHVYNDEVVNILSTNNDKVGYNAPVIKLGKSHTKKINHDVKVLLTIHSKDQKYIANIYKWFREIKKDIKNIDLLIIDDIRDV